MIIFSDFDRTLFFSNDAEKTEQNLKAILEWKKTGNQFIITTGRSVMSIDRVISNSQLYFDYYLTDNGSSVYNNQKELLSTTSFSSTKISEIFETVKDVNVKDLVTIYYNATQEGLLPINNLTKIRFWFRKADEARKIFSTLQKINTRTFLCDIIDGTDYKEAQGFEAFLELAPENSGKETAIRKFVDNNKINEQEIIVVGDSNNDFAMLKQFNGFMISGSDLEKSGATFKKVNSLAELIDQLI